MHLLSDAPEAELAAPSFPKGLTDGQDQTPKKSDKKQDKDKDQELPIVLPQPALALPQVKPPIQLLPDLNSGVANPGGLTEPSQPEPPTEEVVTLQSSPDPSSVDTGTRATPPPLRTPSGVLAFAAQLTEICSTQTAPAAVKSPLPQSSPKASASREAMAKDTVAYKPDPAVENKPDASTTSKPDSSVVIKRDIPVGTKPDTSIETPSDTSVEAKPDTPVETQLNTSVGTKPNSPIGTQSDTSVQSKSSISSDNDAISPPQAAPTKPQNDTSQDSSHDKQPSKDPEKPVESDGPAPLPEKSAASDSAPAAASIAVETHPPAPQTTSQPTARFGPSIKSPIEN